MGEWCLHSRARQRWQSAHQQVRQVFIVTGHSQSTALTVMHDRQHVTSSFITVQEAWDGSQSAGNLPVTSLFVADALA